MSEEFKSIRVSPKKPEETYPFTLYCTIASYSERKSDLDDWIETLADSAGMKGGYLLSVDTASYSEATLNRSKLFETHYPDKVGK